jgi:hypothetical protein
MSKTYMTLTLSGGGINMSLPVLITSLEWWIVMGFWSLTPLSTIFHDSFWNIVEYIL